MIKLHSNRLTAREIGQLLISTIFDITKDVLKFSSNLLIAVNAANKNPPPCGVWAFLLYLILSYLKLS